MKRPLIGMAALLCANAHAQTVVYDSEGFEAPLYQPGPLAGPAAWLGQDSWAAYVSSNSPTVLYPNFDRIIVQGERVHSGAAAVKFDADGHKSPPADTIVVARGQFVPLTLPVLRLDVEVYLESAAVVSEAWSFELQASPFGGYLTTLDILADGTMQARDYYTGTIVPLNASFPRDKWNHLRLEADFAAQIMTFSLNEVPIGLIAVSNYGAFAELDLFNAGHGEDAMYLDNLRIVSTDGTDCYADCNLSGALTVADFACFQTAFVAGNPYADCNGDGQHTVADFGCFQTTFVAGCP
jgi:hypothetical protein